MCLYLHTDVCRHVDTNEFVLTKFLRETHSKEQIFKNNSANTYMCMYIPYIAYFILKL